MAPRSAVALVSLSFFWLSRQVLASPSPSSSSSLPFIGHDISSLIMLEEEQSVQYVNLAGEIQPLEYILAAGGANAARMRIWVDPVEGVYNLTYNLNLASRVEKADMKVYLDFHYSDTWADPQHQIKPAAWANLSFPSLVAQIGRYTRDTIAAFRSSNIRLDLVELGNEIRNGLLWPDGETPNYPNIAKLLKSASEGARAVKSTSRWQAPIIGIHIDDGYSWQVQQTFYDSVLETGLFGLGDFDAQLVSYYPFYNESASLQNLALTTTNMAHRYAKPIIVAETDWPVKCTNMTQFPFPPS
ncbi:glycosyl hydrolase 53, partial [Punctularia strigosozonata HHB-11173 SS5]|uniref:glycosyl hydrolase 53 n=1 Tax=Punctularia strigosozonata (strain HHB-11173) TaxID=741275 RepID=UPI000441784D